MVAFAEPDFGFGQRNKLRIRRTSGGIFCSQKQSPRRMMAMIQMEQARRGRGGVAFWASPRCALGRAQGRRPGEIGRGAITAIYRVFSAAINRFLEHDGWALASHIAMSALMALFPFMIVIASLASMIGASDLANRAATLLFEIWPADIAAPLASEIRKVLTVTRGDALTVGALFAVYFASNGIEALRVGLNRAYGAVEWRAWYWTRLESILFVLVSAAALMIFAVLVVLWPVLWQTVMAWAPALEAQLQPLRFLVGVIRYVVTGTVMFVVLTAAHMLIAAGRRSFRQVMPGVALTIIAWFVGGAIFGAYIADFGQRGYVTTYAGLASVAIALVFLYVLGAIFLLGGEVNAALIDHVEEGE